MPAPGRLGPAPRPRSSLKLSSRLPAPFLPPLHEAVEAAEDEDAEDRSEAEEKCVVGLLSTKDLIIVDPEDALSVETLLAFCGREVLRVWNDTPVNTLFHNFTEGSNSHFAFVESRRREQRWAERAEAEAREAESRDLQPRDASDSTAQSPALAAAKDEEEGSGAAGGAAGAARKARGQGGDGGKLFPIGIVTLEDVLEEIIQAEIVDESDTIRDNVSKCPVAAVQEERSAQLRRTAFTAMLDPKELHDTHLDPIEIAAVSSFLAANVEAFSPLLISAPSLHRLLAASTVAFAEADSRSVAPFEKGKACSHCLVVLLGRIHIVCGSEGFESDRGPWTVLGSPALRQPDYIADFTARVMEPSRLLYITRGVYEQTLRREELALASAVRAAAVRAAYTGEEAELSHELVSPLGSASSHPSSRRASEHGGSPGASDGLSPRRGGALSPRRPFSPLYNPATSPVATVASGLGSLDMPGLMDDLRLPETLRTPGASQRGDH